VPRLSQDITDDLIPTLPLPEAGKAQVFHFDKTKDYFGVRVLASGTRSWIIERRIAGKLYRRTLGDADGPRALTRKQALKQFAVVNGELVQGIDQVGDQREARRAEVEQSKQEQLTFGAALREYVQKKRRRKDGLALKERTRKDYLEMITPGGTSKNGAPKEDGILLSIADKPLVKITGDELRTLHGRIARRGEHRAAYAFRVIRAVLNWSGTAVPGNPMSKDVPERDRVYLKSSVGAPNPIPQKYLGAWWKAACAAGSEVGGSIEAADYYRFQLLTGCRGVEIKGDEHGNPPIHVKDVDLTENRIVRRDTKNRKDHVILLSRQALTIVQRRMEGKKPGAKLFEVGDPRKTLRAINAAAGLLPGAHSGHDLRATFASLGAALVDQFSLKRMLNHSTAGDVTAEHYVDLDDEHLRVGWQHIADFIEKKAGVESELTAQSLGDNVLPLRGAA